MAKIKLTKRQYLGEGYVHYFRKNDTGEILIEPTTKEQYESMGIKGGAVNNPVKVGYTWTHSAGGTFKVDTPSSVLGKNEYCIVGDKAVIQFDVPENEVDVFGGLRHTLKEQIMNDEILEPTWQLQ